MRIRHALPAVLFSSLALSTPVQAQGDVRLGLGAGITVPVRSYADAVDRGWIGMANLTFFPLASTALGFRLDGFYGRNDLSALNGRRTHAGGTASLVLQLGARRSPNRFYLFGGGGYVRTGVDAPGFPKVRNTDPALSAGAGATIGGRGLGIFVEGRYLTVYTDGAKPQFAPLVAGISFGGF